MTHIMIVEARFYEDIADELFEGAKEVLDAAGVTYERIKVPGVFEIPAAISFGVHRRARGDAPRIDGYIALGCVIRGQTSHYDIVAGESARGLTDLAIQHHLAVGNGILTVDSRDQAVVRANRSQKNKGRDAAKACLAMYELKLKFNIADGK